MKKIISITLLICILNFTVNVYSFSYGNENLTEGEKDFNTYVQEHEEYILGKFLKLKFSANVLKDEYILVVDVHGERVEYIVHSKIPVNVIEYSGWKYSIQLSDIEVNDHLLILLKNNAVNSINVIKTKIESVDSYSIAFFGEMFLTTWDTYEVKILTMEGKEVVYYMTPNITINDEFIIDTDMIGNYIEVEDYGWHWKVNKLLGYRLNSKGEINALYTNKFNKVETLNHGRYNKGNKTFGENGGVTYKITDETKIFYLGDVEIDFRKLMSFDYNVLFENITYKADIYNVNENNEVGIVVVKDILDKININTGMIIDKNDNGIFIHTLTSNGDINDIIEEGRAFFINVEDSSIIQNLQVGDVVRFKVTFIEPYDYDSLRLDYIEKVMSTINNQSVLETSLQFKEASKENILGKVTIMNNTNDEYFINIFVGIFNENKLLDLAIKKETINANCSKDVDIQLKPSKLNIDEQYEVKMICWDNRFCPLASPLITTI
jgi:hypothetical protein